jgi:diaminohydroxyphosphoribosylaminopyrimidine deaminase / 5-amino-6-(5-phosphoribosylamino)uracil reductase
VNSEALHSKYMKRCLQLAANGRETCSPNPMVGAVIVHEDRIIGEGWHQKAGEPHAEPNAIRSVLNQAQLKDSTLYVNLEPCSHYGKTPPCVELIIREQIPRVVIGTLDPFPLVSGRGVTKLREAGINVVLSVEERACLELNRVFFHFQTEKRPWIILKWAQTADGYIDVFRQQDKPEPSLKISTPFTQVITHKLRSECDAILVGTNTALLDNPGLNVRSWTGKNPIRVVIDRKGVLPKTAKLLDGSIETIVFTEEHSAQRGKTSFIKIDFNEVFLQGMMAELGRRKIQSLLVEGGAILHESLIQAGLWDEIHVETAVQRIGSGILAPNTDGFLPKPSFRQKFDSGDANREIRYYVRSGKC